MLFSMRFNDITKSINIGNAHFFEGIYAFLHICLCIEVWYYRHTDRYLGFFTQKIPKIAYYCRIVFHRIRLVDKGIHVFDIHYPMVDDISYRLYRCARHIQ